MKRKNVTSSKYKVVTLPSSSEQVRRRALRAPNIVLLGPRNMPCTLDFLTRVCPNVYQSPSIECLCLDGSFAKV